MDLTAFLAQGIRTEWDVLLPVVGRFMVVALFLYLAGQTLLNIPMLQKFTLRPIGQLVHFLLVLGASAFLSFWLLPLRMLHSVGLIYNPAEYLWPDIALSALALSRMSHFWHYLFRWLDRRSAA